MRLFQDGISTSLSKVPNISHHGFWLLMDDREYFVPFKDYPGFTEATITQIYHVQRQGVSQFHWPDIDIDIELEALDKPERYPQKYRP